MKGNRPPSRAGRRPSGTRAGTGVAFRAGEGLQIDLGALPTPKLLGYVDAVQSTDRGYGLEIRFLDSATDVTVSRLLLPRGEALNAFLNSADEFYTTTKQWLDEQKVAPTAVSVLNPKTDLPPAMPVQVFRLARLGMEAEIESYYLSISGASRASKVDEGLTIEVEPVARMFIPLPALVGFLEYVSANREKPQ